MSRSGPPVAITPSDRDGSAPSSRATQLAVPPEHPRRLAFLGSPAAAVPALRALVTAGHEVAVVVTTPDRRRGRGGATSPTPVKAAAVELALPVSHDVSSVVDAGVDLGIVVAYGALIRRPVLERVPFLNIHFSLLPRWRGAAPVEWAILAGDATTGVCLMGLEEGLDTGPVFARAEIPLGETQSAAEVTSVLSELGATLLVDALAAGLGDPTPQTGESTYAAKLTAEDRRLDLEGSAVQAARVVRIGGAWTTVAGARLKVHRARAVDDGPDGGVVDGTVLGFADGALDLVEVQPEGKARMAGADWRRGMRAPGVLRAGS